MSEVRFTMYEQKINSGNACCTAHKLQSCHVPAETLQITYIKTATLFFKAVKCDSHAPAQEHKSQIPENRVLRSAIKNVWGMSKIT